MAIEWSPSGLSLIRHMPFGHHRSAVFVGYRGRLPVGDWISAKLILKKPLSAYKTTTSRRSPQRIRLCHNALQAPRF